MNDHLRETHKAHAEKAKAIYVASQKLDLGVQDWRLSKRISRAEICSALRASSFLLDVEAALRVDAVHMRVFRHLTAPPISQDQFKLVCPGWPKPSEQKGKQLASPVSKTVADVFYRHYDRSLCPWTLPAVPPPVVKYGTS